MLFQWEEDLRQSFLQCGEPALWSRPQDQVGVRTAVESTCSNGRADWVWAGVRCDWPTGIDRDTAGLLQQPTCSRILATLKPEAARREDFLLARSGVAGRTFRRWLLRLLEVGLVRESGKGSYVLGPQFSVPDIEICSFEFKLDNWRRAFYQAKRYRTFSHRVYVVMPPRAAMRVAAEWLAIFERFNIGLISHDADGSSERILASRKQQPASRDVFIRALGMLLGQDAAMPALV